jgi:hypothetical protein
MICSDNAVFCSTWGDGILLLTEEMGRANKESHQLSIHLQNLKPKQHPFHHLKNKKLLCSLHKIIFWSISILNMICKFLGETAHITLSTISFCLPNVAKTTECCTFIAHFFTEKKTLNNFFLEI